MKPTLEFILQFTVGAVFFLSAVPKVRRPRDFVLTVRNYQILPAQLSVAFSALVIVTESGIAFSHLTGLGLAIASPLGVLLLLAFLIGVGRNLAAGRTISCGCIGGADDEPISVGTAARLVLLLIAEGVVLRRLLLSDDPWRVALPSVQPEDVMLFWMPSVIAALLALMWVSAIADVGMLLKRIGRITS